MLNTKPDSVLRKGCQILGSVLDPHGFTLRFDGKGSSSGGGFARASYVRGDWRLELHYRHSLGLVKYHLGNGCLDHRTYMWLVLGKAGGNQYPGFSDDPLDAFRHLAHDLERYAAAFLQGDTGTFRGLVRLAIERPVPTGLKAISSGAGDDPEGKE